MKKFNILKKAIDSQSERLDKIEKVLKVKMLNDLTLQTMDFAEKVNGVIFGKDEKPSVKVDDNEKIINKSDFERARKSMENLTKENQKFEILADWQREFPKSFNKFHDETEYYKELKNGNVDIWFLLSEILDFFNEQSLHFESHYFFGSHDYSWQVCGSQEVEANTSKEAFLKCLQKLLEIYEKTL
jgi:hypothetical protein